eukprot:m.251988 g.251988  ORF g.251988 m.251988 type:complete len:95 (+) comp40342_c0_seq3:1876-2160(+)
MYARPNVDTDQTQIIHQSGHIKDGQIVVQFTRKLDTADVDDFPNLDAGAKAYLLVATGPVASYNDTHGKPMYHLANSWASQEEYNVDTFGMSWV